MQGSDTISQRIALEGAEEIRRQLLALGQAGERMATELRSSAERTTSGLARIGSGIEAVSRPLHLLQNTLLAAVGGGTIAGFVHELSAAAEHVHELSLAAETIGLTVDQFGALAKAGREVGLSLEDIARGFGRLEQRAEGVREAQQKAIVDLTKQVLDSNQLLGAPLVVRGGQPDIVGAGDASVLRGGRERRDERRAPGTPPGPQFVTQIADNLTLASQFAARAWDQIKGSVLATTTTVDQLRVRFLSVLDQGGPAAERLREGFAKAGEQFPAQSVGEALNRLDPTYTDKLTQLIGAIGNDKPDQIIDRVAQAFSKIGDPIKRAAFGMELFGRRWVEFAPLLNNLGQTGLPQLTQAFVAHNFSLEAAAKEAQQQREQWLELANALEILRDRAGLALGRALEKPLEQLTNWVETHGQEIVAWAHTLGEALANLGAQLAPVLKGLALATGSPAPTAEVAAPTPATQTLPPGQRQEGGVTVLSGSTSAPGAAPAGGGAGGPHIVSIAPRAGAGAPEQSPLKVYGPHGEELGYSAAGLQQFFGMSPAQARAQEAETLRANPGASVPSAAGFVATGVAGTTLRQGAIETPLGVPDTEIDVATGQRRPIQYAPPAVPASTVAAPAAGASPAVALLRGGVPAQTVAVPAPGVPAASPPSAAASPVQSGAAAFDEAAEKWRQRFEELGKAVGSATEDVKALANAIDALSGNSEKAVDAIGKLLGRIGFGLGGDEKQTQVLTPQEREQEERYQATHRPFEGIQNFFRGMVGLERLPPLEPTFKPYEAPYQLPDRREPVEPPALLPPGAGAPSPLTYRGVDLGADFRALASGVESVISVFRRLGALFPPTPAITTPGEHPLPPAALQPSPIAYRPGGVASIAPPPLLPGGEDVLIPSATAAPPGLVTAAATGPGAQTLQNVQSIQNALTLWGLLGTPRQVVPPAAGAPAIAGAQQQEQQAEAQQHQVAQPFWLALARDFKAGLDEVGKTLRAAFDVLTADISTFVGQIEKAGARQADGGSGAGGGGGSAAGESSSGSSSPPPPSNDNSGSGTADNSGNQSSGFATGGEISGPRGHDQVPIMATHGEFVHRVAAVEHYGVGAMHAINQLRVPREVVQAFAGGGVIERFRSGGEQIARLATAAGIAGFAVGGLVGVPSLASAMQLPQHFEVGGLIAPAPEYHFAQGGAVTKSEDRGSPSSGGTPVHLHIGNNTHVTYADGETSRAIERDARQQALTQIGKKPSWSR